MINFLKTSRKRYRQKFLTPLTSSDEGNLQSDQDTPKPYKKIKKDEFISKLKTPHNESDKNSKIKSQFLCLECNKSFSTKSNLNKHSKKYHSEQKTTSKENHTDLDHLQRESSTNQIANASELDQSFENNKRIKFLPTDSQNNSLLLNKQQENDLSLIKNKSSKEFDFLNKFHYNPDLMIPIYVNLRQLATLESSIPGMGLRMSGSYVTKDLYCRVFNERSFVHNQNLQIRLQNEYSIAKESKKKNLKNLIKLESIIKGEDNIGFAYPKYEMTFNQFLKFHYDPKIAKSFLLQISSGIRELHNLGYCHRQITPEKILINLKNPSLVLTSFENSQLHSNLTIDEQNQDQLFYPSGIEFTVGNPQIDIFSLICLVVQTYISKDFYCGIKTQEQFIVQVEGLLLNPDLNPELRQIIEDSLITKKFDSLPAIEKIRDLIVDLNFSKTELNLKNQS